MWVEGRRRLVGERLKRLGMDSPFRYLGQRCSPLARVRWMTRMRVNVGIWSVTLAVNLERDLVMEWLLHLLLRRVEVEGDWRFNVGKRNRLLGSWLMHWDTHRPVFWRQYRLRHVVGQLWHVDDRCWAVGDHRVVTLVR